MEDWLWLVNESIETPRGRNAAAESRRTARKRPIPLPPNFGLSDRVRIWAQSKGYAPSLNARLEHFVSLARAKGYVYVDWDEAFMNSCRHDWARLGPPTPPNAPKRVAL